MQVEERPVSVEELLDADEVFCTGTAVVVAPVGSITYLERRQVFSLFLVPFLFRCYISHTFYPLVEKIEISGCYLVWCLKFWNRIL